MSDPAAEPQPAKDKKEKKKKEKSADDGNKSRKSSLKKESLEQQQKGETVPTDNANQSEVAKPPPEVNEPVKEDSEAVKEVPEPAKEVTEPVLQDAVEEQPRPRRKPSRRNLELEIDEEKLNQLKEAFTLFDFDHDGFIDKEDLRKSLIALGKDIHDIDDEELDKMMSEACHPLDFDAFIMLLGYRTIELDPEEILRDALSRWDNDGTGLISEEKFRFDLMHLGDKFTEQEVNMALEDAPVKVGFGYYKNIRMIEYGKFCHILCGLRKKTKDPSLEEFGLDV